MGDACGKAYQPQQDQTRNHNNSQASDQSNHIGRPLFQADKTRPLKGKPTSAESRHCREEQRDGEEQVTLRGKREHFKVQYRRRDPFG
jgi:hypothetical protein